MCFFFKYIYAFVLIGLLFTLSSNMPGFLVGHQAGLVSYSHLSISLAHRLRLLSTFQALFHNQTLLKA